MKLIALKIMYQVSRQVTLLVVTQNTVSLLSVKALVQGDVPVPALAESLEEAP